MGNYVRISSVVLSGSAGSDDYFQNDILYAWGISLVYDGLQESNLITTDTNVKITDIDPATSDLATINISMDNVQDTFSNALYDKRITAVKIYRAESSDKSVENLGLYRLVQPIDINKGHGTVNWT